MVQQGAAWPTDAERLQIAYKEISDLRHEIALSHAEWNAMRKQRNDLRAEVERLTALLNAPLCKRCKGSGQVTWERAYHGECSEFGIEQCKDCKGTGRAALALDSKGD